MFRFLSVVFLSFFLLSNAFAQKFYMDDNSLFKNHVKQIDEFIERFNNESLDDNLTSNEVREKQLINLFNFNKQWDSLVVFDFINYVINDQCYLDFYDKNWYALVDCSFEHEEQIQGVQLTMQINTTDDGRAEWVIKEINAPFLVDGGDNSSLTTSNTNQFMHPMSHSTDFMGLFNIFNKNAAALSDYFDEDLDHEQLSFIQLIKGKKIKYKQVDKIGYHLLQLPDWIIKIEDFNRKDHNSGWLISELIPANNNIKNQYKNAVLSIK